MIVPNLNQYRTYAVTMPIPTHFRPATCAEVQCRAHVNGWKTIVPTDSPQAQYIRSASGRKFVETRAADGLAEFRFEAGQQCFAASEHRASLERDPNFTVRENGLTRTHTRGELWVEDMSHHLDRIKEQREG